MSRLTRSLLSGLPNELDFSFNVLLILSHSNSLSLQKVRLSSHLLTLFVCLFVVVVYMQTPSLLDIILAHVAIFSDGQSFFIKRQWLQQSFLQMTLVWSACIRKRGIPTANWIS